MRRQLRIALYALLSSALVFALGAAIARGTVWRMGALDNLGHDASLWEALFKMQECRRECRNDDEFWHLQEDNMINLGLLSLFALGTGAGVYYFGNRQRSSSERADYKEFSTGAVPDGR